MGSKRLYRHPAFVAVAISIPVTLAIAADWFPWWRVFWDYAVPADARQLLPGIGVLILYIAVMTAWINRLESREGGPSRQTVVLYGLFCAAGGVALQVAFLIVLDANPLRQLLMRTISISVAGYHQVGVSIEALMPFLREFPERMPSFSVHPQIHPPGLPLLYWAAARGFELVPRIAAGLAPVLRTYQCHNLEFVTLSDESIAATTLGMAVPIVSMLTLIPLYRLTRDMYDDRTALRAIGWWPLVPAMIVFTPKWNLFYPLFTVLSLHLIIVGLRQSRWMPFLLCGGLMSVASFLTPTNIHTIGLLVLYIAATVGMRLSRGEWSAGDWQGLLPGLIAFVAGLTVVWVVYYLAAGVSFFDYMRVARIYQLEHVSGYPYDPWIVPWDLWLFGGLALGVLATVRMWRGWRADDALAVALAVSVLGLGLSGIIRAELGRLLLGLMPLVVMLAARTITMASNARLATLAVSIALGVQAVVFAGFLRTLVATDLPVRPTDCPWLELRHGAHVTFGQAVELRGYDSLAVPGEDELQVQLLWKPLTDFHTDQPDYAGVIVVGPNGEVLGVRDWTIGDGASCPDCFHRILIFDQIRVPLENMPPGDYWLSLSVYDRGDIEPIRISSPGLSSDTQVGLGPLPIP